MRGKDQVAGQRRRKRLRRARGGTVRSAAVLAEASQDLTGSAVCRMAGLAEDMLLLNAGSFEVITNLSIY